MTAYDVDLDELRAAVLELADCQRGLLALAGEVDTAQEQLVAGWTGLATCAEATAYDGWRRGCADMVTALAALRAIAEAADGRYSHAVESTVALWHQVGA
ncbi:hypothetical protein GCM10009641_44470 [Mycobacterium cookii]|uniref:WXG100 family type VII secretion target n=1 Tax=Nocardioides furvisabuli TaxID=375542 RepID=A0ABN2XUV9_9ACTN|nr:WXG100 family type VII secretion target [Nocardioides furvisabuli]